MKSFFVLTLLLGVVLASPLCAQLQFNPAIGQEIVFEDTPVGETAELNYTAINNSRTAYNVRLSTEAPFSGDPAQFMVPGGQRVGFQLNFTPEQAGEVNGDLVITYWQGVNNPQQIAARLSGVGIAEGGPQIDVDSDSLDLFLFVDELGSIWDGSSVDLAVMNTGDDTLIVQSIRSNVNWLTIDPVQFDVLPIDEQMVTVGVPEDLLNAMEPGIYEAAITITSNDPDQGRLVVPVILDRGLIPNYLVVLGDAEPAANHALLIEDAIIGDAELEVWDEVGVFTPRDELAGSGYLDGEWPIVVLAWGEDQQAGFNGFREGEAFTFRLWDHSAETEYAAEAEYFEGPTTFEADGISDLALMSAPDQDEQVIILHRGFNLISLNVIPEDRYWQREEGPDVRLIFADVRENVVFVKNDHGAFYAPANNDFNSIPFWPLDRGMMVRMREADTLIISGRALPNDHEIALSSGWNFVAYYPDYPLLMYQAFGELVQAGTLVIAKNIYGQFYIPRYDFGGETRIEPNDAIQVKVTEDCSFNYPGQQNLLPSRRDGDIVRHFPQPQMTDVNMSVLIEEITGIDVVVGAEVAAFTPSNMIAGAWTVDTSGVPFGLALWGDSGTTNDTIEGFREGETIRFRYWDPAHRWELDITPNVIEGGQAVYQTNGFLVIGAVVGVEENIPVTPARFKLCEPYPNPFNQRINVNFELPQATQASLVLVDAASGRTVATLLNDERPAGRQSIAFDGQGLPTGVYMLVLRASGQEQSRKVLLLK